MKLKINNLFVQGLIVLAMAACLVSFSTAAPAPAPAPFGIIDPLSAIAFTTAGGLVLTAVSGSVVTIPTSTLLLGKAIVLKGALLKHLASEQ